MSSFKEKLALKRKRLAELKLSRSEVDLTLTNTTEAHTDSTNQDVFAEPHGDGPPTPTTPTPTPTPTPPTLTPIAEPEPPLSKIAARRQKLAQLRLTRSQVDLTPKDADADTNQTNVVVDGDDGGTSTPTPTSTPTLTPTTTPSRLRSQSQSRSASRQNSDQNSTNSAFSSRRNSTDTVVSVDGGATVEKTTIRRRNALAAVQLKTTQIKMKACEEKLEKLEEELKLKDTTIEKLTLDLAAKSLTIANIPAEEATTTDAVDDDATAALKQLLADTEQKSQEMLAELQLSLEREQKLKSKLGTSQAEADTMKEQLRLLGDMLLAGGQVGGDHADARPAMSVEKLTTNYEEMKESSNQYELLFEEAMEEIEELKAKNERLSSNREYLDGALDDYEAQVSDMLDELTRLREIEATHDATTSHRSRTVETWQAKSNESEALLEQSRAKETVLTAEVAVLRKELNDVKTTYAETRQHSSKIMKELEKYEEKVANLVSKERETGSELEEIAKSAQDESYKIQNELLLHKSLAEKTAQELENFRHASAADVESVKNALNDHQLELALAKNEAKIAKDEAAELETTMNQAVSELKQQVASATNGMEGAALAGLGLSEMLTKLKEDHEAEVTRISDELEFSRSEHEKCAADLTDVTMQLEDRDKMLTGIMEHLQHQAGATDESETKTDGGIESLGDMMERNARAKEMLEATLAEFEEENRRLETNLIATSLQLSETEIARRKLQSDLETSTEAFTSTSSQLEEKAALLERVMGMLKQSGIGARLNNDDDDGNDDADKDPLGGLASLEDQLAALMQHNTELEAETQRLATELQTVIEQAATLNERCLEQNDEMDVMSTRLVELDETKTIRDNLQVMVDEGNKAQSELRDENEALTSERDALRIELGTVKAELQNIRDLFEGASSEADAAARGGLGLLEMLEKLKLDYEAKISTLQARVTELESEVAMKDAAMTKLLDFLPQDEGTAGEAGIDVLTMLEARLKRAAADKDSLEAMLADYESQLEDQSRQIESLTQEIETLQANVVALKNRLAKTEEDLAALESEINSAVQSASRSASPRKSKGGGNDDDSDEEEVHHTGGGGVSDLLETIEALTAQLNESETERELQAAAAAELHTKYNANLETLQDVRDMLQTREEEIKEKDGEIRQLEATIATLEENLEDFRAQHAELTTKYNASLETLQGVRDVLKTREEEIKDKENKISQLEATVATLEENLEDLRAQHAKLQAELEEQIEKCRALQAQYDAYKKEMEGVVSKLKEKLRTLRHQSKQSDLTSAAEALRLQNKIDEISQKLMASEALLQNFKDWVRKKTLRVWEEDTKVADCSGCDDTFSMMVRRHHCRICGQVFCKSCSSFKVQTTSKKKAVRSCEECFNFHTLLMVHDNKADTLGNTGFQLDEKEVELTKKSATQRNGFEIDIVNEIEPLTGIVVVVTSVDPKGIAHAKLSVGDRITSVSGESVSTLTEKKFLNLLKPLTVDLTVKSKTSILPSDDVASDSDASDVEDGVPTHTTVAVPTTNVKPSPLAKVVSAPAMSVRVSGATADPPRKKPTNTRAKSAALISNTTNITTNTVAAKTSTKTSPTNTDEKKKAPTKTTAKTAAKTTTNPTTTPTTTKLKDTTTQQPKASTTDIPTNDGVDKADNKVKKTKPKAKIVTDGEEETGKEKPKKKPTTPQKPDHVEATKPVNKKDTGAKTEPEDKTDTGDSDGKVVQKEQKVDKPVKTPSEDSNVEPTAKSSPKNATITKKKKTTPTTTPTPTPTTTTTKKSKTATLSASTSDTGVTNTKLATKTKTVTPTNDTDRGATLQTPPPPPPTTNSKVDQKLKPTTTKTNPKPGSVSPPSSKNVDVVKTSTKPPTSSTISKAAVSLFDSDED